MFSMHLSAKAQDWPCGLFCERRGSSAGLERQQSRQRGRRTRCESREVPASGPGKVQPLAPWLAWVSTQVWGSGLSVWSFIRSPFW